ncbi:hypothetical protein [Synechococcus sp. MIT S9504]|uniref:hypothetical protein n=1 Tax=Synechococcus sp. MIT S9504 TaxID=1801628 RepID=UPI000AF09364
MVAVAPIVTTMKPSVDPHLYRFARSESDVVRRLLPGDHTGINPSGCVVVAFRKLSMSFIRFAYDFLSLLPR